MSYIKIWNKEGVMGDLCPELQKELGRVIDFHEHNGYVNFYITSKREGDHKSGSFHPIGRAVDFATDMDYKRLRAIVGLDFDLVPFADSDHMHLEYDPKKKI